MKNSSCGNYHFSQGNGGRSLATSPKRPKKKELAANLRGCSIFFVIHVDQEVHAANSKAGHLGVGSGNRSDRPDTSLAGSLRSFRCIAGLLCGRKVFVPLTSIVHDERGLALYLSGKFIGER
jgi:hypothetical protein